MKTTIIMSAFLLSASLLAAQTTNKPATVHIKKIENINGVEKITDTTFTTSDPGSIKVQDGTIDIIGLDGDHDGKQIETIIINEGDGEKIEIKELSKELNEELEKALKEAGVDGTTEGTKKIVIINNDEEKSPAGKKETKITKTIVIKRIDITDASSQERKRIGNTADADGKLKIEKMNFYPNPSTGKFNLTFTLPEKGDAEIVILNIDGKIIYKESLPNFSNTYDKEIDISKNAKGVYFVKVEQGKHAQVKKIVLE